VRVSLDRAEARGLRLAPHIMIGIAWGRVIGERRALEMLRGRNVAALSLVVLTPLRNTPMADVKLDLAAVLELLSEAREAFPGIRMTLGCAKTGGRTQRALEEHALRVGFDAIAYPSEGIVDLARSMGYTVKLSESCCAFSDLDDFPG
jgi:lipoyl synthase